LITVTTKLVAVLFNMLLTAVQRCRIQ